MHQKRGSELCKLKIGAWKLKNRVQKLELGTLKLEIGIQKLATVTLKLDFEGWKLELGARRPRTGHGGAWNPEGGSRCHEAQVGPGPNISAPGPKAPEAC